MRIHNKTRYILRMRRTYIVVIEVAIILAQANSKMVC